MSLSVAVCSATVSTLVFWDAVEPQVPRFEVVRLRSNLISIYPSHIGCTHEVQRSILYIQHVRNPESEKTVKSLGAPLHPPFHLTTPTIFCSYHNLTNSHTHLKAYHL
ncbi:hypothetical protein F5Y13DRAFT_165268 [Hypoxylon sp. FL1857]|nr:hypothetical protein F5Y13DRAFT_165268 [Hypoxylon sp. FL1857]